MNPNPPPPAVLAEIDQWHKHVSEHLDNLVAATRVVIAENGAEAAAAIGGRVADMSIQTKPKIAALLGVALVRLAQSTQEPTK